jgi:hypothetical protein
MFEGRVTCRMGALCATLIAIGGGRKVYASLRLEGSAVTATTEENVLIAYYLSC